MANDFSSNPLRIDTAMAATYQHSSPPNNLSIYPRRIVWYDPTAADTFLIADPNGQTLYEGIAATTGVTVDFEVAPGVKWRDFKVTFPVHTGSGVIFIYFTS